jgi:hypothetical protein
MDLTSLSIKAPDDIGDFFTHVVGLVITDGLPVIPPTAARVAEMIDYMQLAPDKVIGIIPPEYWTREISVPQNSYPTRNWQHVLAETLQRLTRR